MKRFVKIYTYWLLGILLFTGCDDYLKEDPGESGRVFTNVV